MDWRASENVEREDEVLAVAASEMLALIPDGVVGTDAIGTVLFLSPTAERLFGYSADEVIGCSIGQLLPERFYESHKAFMRRFGEAEGEEQRVMAERAEVLGRRKDGGEFSAEVSISRRRLGQRTILTAVVRDISERRQLERQLREHAVRVQENERRLRLALDSGELGTWAWEAEAGLLRIDRSTRHLIGHYEEGSISLCRLISIVVPEDRSKLEAAFARGLEGARLDCEFKVCLPDGTTRDILFKGSGDENSVSVDGLFGVARDVTRRRKKEQHRDLLVGELNHRISNLMSVVQSVIRLTAQHHDTAQGLSDALRDRLSAVAERHQLINREGWKSVGLDSLLSAELRPYAAPDGSNLELEGAPLRISAAAATSLGLVLHEMATNSAKYGALSSASGRLAVSWHADEGADALNIVWDERGGPVVIPPRRKGFGTSLVQRVLTSQLGGDLQAAYPPAGFQTHIRLPLGNIR